MKHVGFLFLIFLFYFIVFRYRLYNDFSTLHPLTLTIGHKSHWFDIFGYWVPFNPLKPSHFEFLSFCYLNFSFAMLNVAAWDWISWKTSLNPLSQTSDPIVPTFSTVPSILGLTSTEKSTLATPLRGPDSSQLSNWVCGQLILVSF